jgi:hydrogenase expression/formation protein HypC
MCLGVPGRVAQVNQGEGWALVEAFGVGSKVGIALIDEEILPGDYLMVHAGYAIGKIAPEDATASLEIWEEILDGA